MVRPDDATLVRKCLAGKTRAFGHLYERYRPMVYELAYRMTRNREEAEDVLQDTFVRAMRALATYDTRYKFSTWILTIANRLCVDRWRASRRTQLSLDEDYAKGGFQLPHPGDGPDEDTFRREVAVLVEEGLRRVPEDYRLMLILRHRLELSYEEIAAVTGMPLGTVKTRIHRARERLARALSAHAADLMPEGGETLS
jgi:RNA polymerase sigma-70 factor (ECF subfamily)